MTPQGEAEVRKVLEQHRLTMERAFERHETNLKRYQKALRRWEERQGLAPSAQPAPPSEAEMKRIRAEWERRQTQRPIGPPPPPDAK